ncbi:MAG TPA: hypothetical protein VJB82_00535 [Candidatus Peribacterales bacterium]|nr:hypothetical protein [Candidatus Peribacterales bacterium]
MKRSIFLLLPILAACSYFAHKEYALNPDPENHIHADFAVWIGEEKIDFTDPKYMSGVSYDEESHDEEKEYHHQYLHLHDNVGSVIHTHKVGYTIADFLGSIGFVMSARCMRLDTGVDLCPNELGESWRMFVRHRPLIENEWQEVPWDPHFEFEDMDQILLTFQNDDEESMKKIEAQKNAMTDDACLYSKTCPWRGDPPTENCIADPEVPCVLGE